MKRGRSGVRHAIAPQAMPAWQVIHLLDLITENKGHIPVVPHLLSSSLLKGTTAEFPTLCFGSPSDPGTKFKSFTTLDRASGDSSGSEVPKIG